MINASPGKSVDRKNAERSNETVPKTVRLTVVRKPSIPSADFFSAEVATMPAGSQQAQYRQLSTTAGSTRYSSYTIEVPSAPVEFLFVRKCLGSGLRSLTGTVFGLGVGNFLATHITTTPPLHSKVAFVAAVCCLLGLATLRSAIRGLTGKFRVDSRGVRMAPRFFGFSINWQDLDRWSVEGLHFHFESSRTKKTHILNLDYLSAEERRLLRDVMRACAPEKEGRATVPALA